MTAERADNISSSPRAVSAAGTERNRLGIGAQVPLEWWLLGATLVLLLSPISHDGNILVSSLVGWSGVAATGIAISRRNGVAALYRAVPRPIALSLSTMLCLVSIYAVYGVAKWHNPRIVAWDAQPFFEFAAFTVLGFAVLRTRTAAVRMLALLTFAAAGKALYDFILFARDLPGFAPGLDYLEAARIVDAVPFILAPLPVLVALSGALPDVRRRVAWVIAAIVVTVVLIATFTRTYWIGFILALGVAATILRGAILRRLAFISVAVIALFAVAGIAFPRTAIGHDVRLLTQRAHFTAVQLSGTKGDPLAQRRQIETERALSEARRSWFLGRGLGASFTLQQKYIKAWAEDSSLESVHNYYVHVLWKLGIPGALALAFVAMTCLATMLKGIRRTTGLGRVLVVGTLAIWIMEATQLALYSFPNVFHTSAFVAVALGASAAIASAGTEDV